MKPLAADGAIDGREAGVAGHARGDRVARDRAAEQEGRGRAEVGGDPDERRADGDAVGKPGAHREQQAGHEEHGGQDVDRREEHHARPRRRRARR